MSSERSKSKQGGRRGGRPRRKGRARARARDRAPRRAKSRRSKSNGKRRTSPSTGNLRGQRAAAQVLMGHSLSQLADAVKVVDAEPGRGYLKEGRYVLQIKLKPPHRKMALSAAALDELPLATWCRQAILQAAKVRLAVGGVAS